MARATKQEQQWRSTRLEIAGMLTGSVAHDFNNLLTLINAHAEAAQDELPKNSEAAKELAAIVQLTGKAGALTSQLLGFLRRTPSTEKPLHLNTLIEQSSGMYKRLLGETIQLSIKLGNDIPLILADLANVEQILVNLLVNSKEAMPDGGLVELTTSTVGKSVRLQVADNGPGMDDATKSRVFEPFFTTRESDGGTGIGLSTVATIVKAAGGVIHLETSPGHGASFVIDWPAIPS